MNCVLSFLILALVSQTFSFRFGPGLTDEDKIKKAGELQTFLLEYLMSAGDNTNKCSTPRDIMNDEARKALQCLGEIKINNSFCETFVNHFESCTKKMIEYLDGCFEENEKGILVALVSALVSEADYICNTDGEHIAEILNPCVFSTLRDMPRNCTKVLQKKIDELLQSNSTNQKDTKILVGICRAASSTKECVSETFKQHCLNEVTRNTIEEMYNAATKPCKEILDIK